MTTITEAERGKALSEVIRSLSYLDPEGRGDNLAILLCCVFDEHQDCPADEHEGDYGWKPWVAERADAALLMLAGGAIDALLSLGWHPAPVVDDAMVERAAAAWSICSGTGFSWSEMSEKWREGVRARVHNVLLAALSPET